MWSRRYLLASGLVGILLGCAGDPLDESNTGIQSLVGPLCHQGCIEIDPNPNAPGVFLGSAVTGETCVAGGQSDHDGDGLSTFCENNLAIAFAPELYYDQWDEVGREPYWVAAPVSPNDTDNIKIAYLIGYYRDAGSSTYTCGLPGAPSSCFGHNGDSEAIILEVYYDYDTEHWVLGKAKYSQHTSYGIYSKGSNAYPTQLMYPSHQGAYPRAYVAEGKHANYNSESACNAGGTLGTDTCESVDTPARVFVSGVYNLGSNSVRLINCTTSRDPSYIYYGSGRQECFWTDTIFRGWIPTSIGGAASDPYKTRLNAEGF
ncbi:MAG: hypothetical protein R2910_02555 [Gemmatimonadales bacterium]